MTIKKVLVVEDEEIVAWDLQVCLQSLGYEVCLANSAAEAVDLVKAFSPDVVLMDIKLDDSIDGIEAARRIQEHSEIPIVFLTAYADPATVARAAGVAPDGYIVKPFKDLELAAAVYLAIHKKEQRDKGRSVNQEQTAFPKTPREQPITILGQLHIDHIGRRVLCGDRGIRLTNKEFRILELLSASLGAPQSPEKILSAVWGPEFVHYVQALRVHIKNLRKKLGSDSGVVLEVVHSVGYRLVAHTGSLSQHAG